MQHLVGLPWLLTREQMTAMSHEGRLAHQLENMEMLASEILPRVR